MSACKGGICSKGECKYSQSLQVAEMVFERSKLLKWMLGRLRPREFDSNKQSTAELLAILLQNSPKNQQRLADANGIDALLQVAETSCR